MDDNPRPKRRGKEKKREEKGKKKKKSAKNTAIPSDGNMEGKKKKVTRKSREGRTISRCWRKTAVAAGLTPVNHGRTRNWQGRWRLGETKRNEADRAGREEVNPVVLRSIRRSCEIGRL